MAVRIKICCISSVEEAKLAVACGAHAIGLVARMPSGPGPIPDFLIKEIAAITPPSVSTFLLTCETKVTEIIKHHGRTLTTTIQIVDRLTEGSHRDLKMALPLVKIVQVIHVTGTDSVDEAVSISDNVDALLLDSGNQSLNVKELGGTGRVHDWRLSREIVTRSSCPVFLAGGLNCQNVGKAISEVNPFGVDVCSGVRTDGRLDADKLRQFSLNAMKQKQPSVWKVENIKGDNIYFL